MGSGPVRAESLGTGWILAFLVSLVRVRFSLVFPYRWLGPNYDRLGRSGSRETDIVYKKPTAVASAAAETLPWPFGPHVAG